MSSHIISSGKFFKVVCRFVPGLQKYSACGFGIPFPFHVHALNTEFYYIVTWVEFHILKILILGRRGQPYAGFSVQCSVSVAARLPSLFRSYFTRSPFSFEASNPNRIAAASTPVLISFRVLN